MHCTENMGLWEIACAGNAGRWFKHRARFGMQAQCCQISVESLPDFEATDSSILGSRHYHLPISFATMSQDHKSLNPQTGKPEARKPQTYARPPNQKTLNTAKRTKPETLHLKLKPPCLGRVRKAQVVKPGLAAWIGSPSGVLLTLGL